MQDQTGDSGQAAGLPPLLIVINTLEIESRERVPLKFALLTYSMDRTILKKKKCSSDIFEQI